jgi:hypothetical protein
MRRPSEPGPTRVKAYLAVWAVAIVLAIAFLLLIKLSGAD